jgi:FkbM family methyltransferase
VLDVGAHIGLYSLRASRLVGPEGFVIGFEPNPYAFYWLLSNIKLNRINNVKALPIALGDYNGFMEFYVVTKGNIGASSMIHDHVKHQLGEEVHEYKVLKVPTYKLEDIVPKLSYLKNSSDIDLVKIDVEGAELKVLRGATKLLEKATIERLIIEIHTDVVDESDVISFLKGYNYRIDALASLGNVKKMLYARCSM